MATELELIVGPRIQADGTTDGPIRISRMGSQVVTDAHGRYFEAARLAKTYTVVATGITAPTGAWPLGAGGTPLIGIWNPAGTGVNLSFIQISVAVRSCGTTSPGSFALSGGVTAAVTGTATIPTNLLTLQTSGSLAKGFVNTAATGSTALLSLRPIVGIGAPTAATNAYSGVATDDTAGSIICPPGCMIALTSTVTGAAAAIDAGMIWEEVPV